MMKEQFPGHMHPLTNRRKAEPTAVGGETGGVKRDGKLRGLTDGRGYAPFEDTLIFDGAGTTI